jgi:hypothetical protein
MKVAIPDKNVERKVKRIENEKRGMNLEYI